MSTSILDIFKIGIGPSSSHTLGPMKIARRFLEEAGDNLAKVHSLSVQLFGSLALTGKGHATDKACILGLLGFDAETIDTSAIDQILADINKSGKLTLLGKRAVEFDAEQNILFAPDDTRPIPDQHPNGMRLLLLDANQNTIFSQEYYSIGGGSIRRSDEMNSSLTAGSTDTSSRPPLAFDSGDELLAACRQNALSIAELTMLNEDSFRPRAQTNQRLDKIWEVMTDCIDRGLAHEGVLPGSLKVRRRAKQLWAELNLKSPNERESLFDWLNVFAMAVNEENAAGNQVVTSPTNGAAGIIPAVIRYYCCEVEEHRPDRIRTFLATAGAIGMLYKTNASISGAEMGCQGEVGVACSMAAAGLAAVWGATPEQVEHAAEIGMEHNLGLTCDPVGGLVQIPCIERNAIGAVKAVNAARLAIKGTGHHHVSLDQVIETMRQTGEDMSQKYKETSEGGLAVNVVEC